MARLQILELPEGDSDERPPFVLVIDQYESTRAVLSPEEGDQLREWWQHIAEQAGARGALVFPFDVDIPANDTTAYLTEAVVDSETSGPDFTSPIAERVEVRQPCPYCGDRQMIPRAQFTEHVARLHPDPDA
ncbi:hypothetical protein [Streptomyces lasiicapitis]|uniref:hypothetical protein n=1 Tax=Streptomyces lasiicapitis TaxID=1923961 RepID=UPI0036C243E3